MRSIGVVPVVLFLLTSGSVSGAVLWIPDQVGHPGDTVLAAISFSAENQAISGLQFDLEWDQPLDLQAATGSQVGASSKILYSSSPAPRVLRFLIIGMNHGILADGEVLKAFIALSPAAGPGVAQVRLTNVTATDPDGQAVPIRANSADIQIQDGDSIQPFLSQAVLNSASLLSGSVSPGEIVTMFGAFGANASNSSLALLFDGVQAPVLYAGPSQVNAVVPF